MSSNSTGNHDGPSDLKSWDLAEDTMPSRTNAVNVLEKELQTNTAQNTTDRHQELTTS